MNNETQRLYLELCTCIADSISVDQKKHRIDSLDDLRIGYQREIAWAWMEWKLTSTNDTSYFVDLLDTPDVLNLINALIRTVDYLIDDDLADKILSSYRDQIEDVFSAQLREAA